MPKGLDPEKFFYIIRLMVEKSETAKNPCDPLPKGCVELPPQSRGELGLVGRLLTHANSITPEKWERRWGKREMGARLIFNTLVHEALRGNLGPIVKRWLSYINEDTGLAYKIILAKGLDDLNSGQFVLTTSNRLGLRSKGKMFAIGGEIHFKISYGKASTGARIAEGNIIGVVLNTQSPVAALPPVNREGTISMEQTAEAIGSLINVYESKSAVEKRGKLDSYLNQKEFDKAVNWVLFGKTT